MGMGINYFNNILDHNLMIDFLTFFRCGKKFSHQKLIKRTINSRKAEKTIEMTLISFQF